MIVIERQQAIIQGLARYFTGIPCVNAHISERYTKDFRCIKCVNKNSAASHRRNSESIEYKRSRDRMSVRKHVHGIDTQTVLRIEPLSCEVCKGTNKDGRSLSCDHEHSTGKFRGWLCSNCNFLLGMLEAINNPNERVRLLLSYKEKEAANNAGVILTKEEFERLHYGRH